MLTYAHQRPILGYSTFYQRQKAFDRRACTKRYTLLYCHTPLETIHLRFWG